MWPILIVVFKLATECTEVKFTCTTCDTCEMEKISKSMVNLTSAYPGVITRKEHLPKATITRYDLSSRFFCIDAMVHSLSSGKGKMFLCAACYAFTPHVNAWKNLIGIVVQIQARG